MDVGQTLRFLCLFHWTFLINHAVQGHKHMGCYVDNLSHRLLSGMKLDFPRTLTIEICINKCKENKFRYAGVEFRKECFCSNDRPSYKNLAEESDCSYPCDGNRNQRCGGENRLNVYDLEEETLNEVAELYVGCFENLDNNELLPNAKKDTEILTPVYCVGYCYRRGYKYAGLQNAIQCYCGNELDETRKTKNDFCSVGCSGERSFMCGGNWRLSIYTTGVTAGSQGPPFHKHMGCYKETSTNKLLPAIKFDFPRRLTIEICLIKCKENKFRYSGVGYRKVCFCSNDRPSYRNLADESDCSHPCDGNPKQLCGADKRLNVYDLEDEVSNEVAGLYVGCFENLENNKLLPNARKDTDILTPVYCVGFCHRRGYGYAGLQNAIECYCGDKFDLTRILNNDECSVGCAGERSFICGGNWMLSIYRTNVSENVDETHVTPISVSVPGDVSTPSSVPIKPTSPTCQPSTTSVHGKKVCSGDIIFSDDFNQGILDFSKWSHTILMPTVPNYEFVTYTSSPENSYLRNGRLVIEPTLQTDDYISKGTIVLNNCTGQQFSEECEKQAKSIYILPPVASAKLYSRNFSFKYGIVQILARLPIGDWLLPVVWLEPTWKNYGPGLASGRINIASALGNRKLETYEGEEIGNEILTSGISVASRGNIMETNITRKRTKGWSSDFHNYTFVWTPSRLSFTIDGRDEMVIFDSGSSFFSNSLTSKMGFDENELQNWIRGSSIAPFDQEFQLSLGLIAGGMRGFPDRSVSSGKAKPWEDWSVRGMYNFWKAKPHWYPTWSQPFEIESVTVTAL